MFVREYPKFHFQYTRRMGDTIVWVTWLAQQFNLDLDFVSGVMFVIRWYMNARETFAPNDAVLRLLVYSSFSAMFKRDNDWTVYNLIHKMNQLTGMQYTNKEIMCTEFSIMDHIGWEIYMPSGMDVAREIITIGAQKLGIELAAEDFRALSFVNYVLQFDPVWCVEYDSAMQGIGLAGMVMETDVLQGNELVIRLIEYDPEKYMNLKEFVLNTYARYQYILTAEHAIIQKNGILDMNKGHCREAKITSPRISKHVNLISP